MDKIVFEQVNGPVQFTIEASGEEGDLLVFRNAVLARAEVNRNGDEITPQGIAELAASIAGKPIDVEHDRQKVCGFYTKGVPTEDRALAVDGVIFASRFREVADGVVAGTHLQSIEASARTATCSICNQTFSAATGYCEHLINRRKSGAQRKVEGLKADGGGIVRSPAATNPVFDRSALYFIASHYEIDPLVTDESHTHTEEVVSTMETKEDEKKEPPEEEKKETPEEEKKEQGDCMKAQYEAQLADLQSKLDQAVAAQTEAIAAQTAAETKATQMQAERDALTARLTKMILSAAFSDTELSDIEAKVNGWSLDQIELLASTRGKVTPAPKQGMVALTGSSESPAVPQKNRIVLKK